MRCFMSFILASILFAELAHAEASFGSGQKTVSAPNMRRKRSVASQNKSEGSANNKQRTTASHQNAQRVTSSAAVDCNSAIGGLSKEENSLIVVKGRGIGCNKIDALKDAYRDAVERAVGLFVDAEQVMNNGQQFSDRILTHSNAYIEKYDEVRVNNHGELMEIEIRATVRRGALVKKLREVIPGSATDLSSANKNLHAQVSSEQKRSTDAMALLKSEFEKFNPLTQLYSATISKVPEVEKHPYDQNSVRLMYRLKLEVDSHQYYKVLVPRLKRVLSQISIQKSRPFVYKRDERMKDEGRSIAEMHLQKVPRTDFFAFDDFYFIESGTPVDHPYVFGAGSHDEYDLVATDVRLAINFRVLETQKAGPWHTILERSGSLRKMNATPIFSVALVTRVTPTQVCGMEYFIDAGSADVIRNWMRQYSGVAEERRRYESEGAEAMSTYHISFSDKDGELISLASVSAQNCSLTNIGIFRTQEGSCAMEDRFDAKIPYVIYITPFVGCFAKECTTWFSVDIPRDEIPRIVSASVSCE